MAQFAYVGCYTSRQRAARGRGIEVYEIDNAGKWFLKQTVQPVQDNPSWLILDSRGGLLHAVHGDGTALATYGRDPLSGLLTLLGERSTGPQNPHPALDPKQRNNPVHVAYDPSGRYLLVANLNAGNVAVFPIGIKGIPDPVCSIIPIPGRSSPDHHAPGLSRPHEIVFDHGGKHFALPIQGRSAGNGIDRVRIYAFNAGQCVLTDEVDMAAGSWPRHVDFHPDGRFLYVLNEISNTISVFDYDETAGSLALRQTLSSLPPDYAGRSDAGEIEVHANGRFLYASNRGHDSIGVFGIDRVSGGVHPIGWVPCGGKNPRFTTLTPDGRRFYSANEESDTLTEFLVNAESGMLENTGRVISTPSPTCVIFA
ncbi:lactonase family protein [Sodalis sp. dw_96]|uniref:lactonase family protein n=1 Tax=Sodalis sp. dw_96 TaxID=2719794 RepID=UPI001BD1BD27|nr:lactonase family protein [Sodalis sp. dw_96]